MRIIYFGTGSFAVPALQRLAPHIILSVSQPDRPTGRGLKLQPSPVKLAATELGIPTATPERSRSPEFVAELQALNADFLLVASYGQILSTAVLEAAKRGGINLHGSLLPKYRGAAPIQRAILNGEAETGITLMQMDKGMDTGDMIAVERTPIGPDETYGELQGCLAEIAADMAVAWSERLSKGDYPREAQSNEEATTAPKIDRDETQIRLTETSSEAYNRFRAFYPAPGPFMETSSGRVKLHGVRNANQGEAGTPGTVLALGDSVVVACSTGALRLLSVQPEGKRPMPARDWANGTRLRIGDNLLS